MPSECDSVGVETYGKNCIEEKLRWYVVEKSLGME